jgi:hypothetical protein
MVNNLFFLSTKKIFFYLESDSARDTSSDNLTRPRRDTYTIYEVKQSSGPFFTDRKSTQNRNTSILQEKYKKQQECEECLRRDHIIHHERRDLQYLYNQNKKLTNQLRSYILLNHQYKDDIQKLKYHLTKVNSHLNEYQINYDHLKQKIVYDKKPNPKIDEEEEEQDTQDDTDHIKRLRYEIQMYNRIVAAKQKQEEKTEQNQFDFLF